MRSFTKTRRIFKWGWELEVSAHPKQRKGHSESDPLENWNLRQLTPYMTEALHSSTHLSFHPLACFFPLQSWIQTFQRLHHSKSSQFDNICCKNHSRSHQRCVDCLRHCAVLLSRSCSSGNSRGAAGAAAAAAARQYNFHCHPGLLHSLIPMTWAKSISGHTPKLPKPLNWWWADSLCLWTAEAHQLDTDQCCCFQIWYLLFPWKALL